MKLIIINIFALILTTTIFSFTSENYDESAFSNDCVQYNVTRRGSTAIVRIHFSHISKFDKIYLKRSNGPFGDYEEVSFATKSEFARLQKEGLIIDNEPLPSDEDAYYKIVAYNRDGVYKSFPCVKLNKK